jgi:hypothetical protein
MILKNTLFLLLFPLLMGSNCRDDCNEPVPYHSLDKDFLSYCVFPEGSWWVYEEENSGEIDSTYIISKESGRREGILGRGCDVRYEYEAVNIRKVIRGEELYATAYPQIVDANSVWHYAYNQGSTLHFFKFPDNRDTLTEDFFKTRYDSLIVSGKIYKDVIEIRSGSYWSEFYSKDVGLIRREFNDSTKWNLIKYYIEN